MKQITKFVQIKHFSNRSAYKDLNISVVIPNYNGKHLFPETLPALFEALTFSKVDYEVILVDDTSTDGSVEYLNDHYPDIKILQNKINSGFSVTVNRGIYAARNELVLLLNSDVKLENNYFISQFKYFQHGDTFGVMGKIEGWNDKLVQDGAKYSAFNLFKFKTSGNYLIDDPTDEEAIYTSYLSGANALIRRDKLLQLAGLDQIYSPFYMEDVDLSVRAWRCGWKCYFEPAAICHHKTSTSIRAKDKKQYIRTIYNRNKLYFHAIHLEGLPFWGWTIQVFLELIARVVTFRWDYLKSVMLLLKNWQQVKASSKRNVDLYSGAQEGMNIFQVKKFIKRSLTDRKVRYFKS